MPPPETANNPTPVDSQAEARPQQQHAVDDRLDQLLTGDAPLHLGHFGLDGTGLVVTGSPPYEEWERCGAVLHQIDGAVQWWLGDWLNYGEHAYGEKYSQALGATDYERRTLEDYAYVAANVPPTVRTVGVGWSLHKLLAPHPPREQTQWLARAANGEDGVPWTHARLRTELRLAKRHEQYAGGDLPEGQFRVVYADPPWQYDDSGVITSGDAYGRAERHYPTMSIEDLCGLPVQDHVDDDAVLFLWVTSPMLAACWPVIEAWGFTYKTSLVWDKVAHNYGHYVSVRHELLLLCTRGSCTPDAPTPMPDSVVIERRSEVHSEKPARFRELIERLYPLGRRLELFGRHEVDGWTVYGNQLQPIARG